MSLALPLALPLAEPLGGRLGARGGALPDPDALIYAAAVLSGSGKIITTSDVLFLSQRIRTLKSLGIWNNLSDAWIAASAFNAGSGATVYGLKGNNFASTGGPTWDADGLNLDGSSQFLSRAKLVTGNNCTGIALVDFNAVNIATNQSIFGQYLTTGNQRSWQATLQQLTTNIRAQTSTNGTGGTNTDTTTIGAITQTTLATAFAFSPSTLLFIVDGRIMATSPNPTATLFNSTASLVLGATNTAPGLQFLSGKIRSFFLFNTPLTSVQISKVIYLMGTLEKRPLIAWWGDSFTQSNHLGFNDVAATVRITPPTLTMNAAINSHNFNNGVTSETASQIATRAIASTAFSDATTVIWAGTNDKDNTNFAAVANSVQSIINNLSHARYVIMMPHTDSTWTGTQKTNIANIRTEYLSRWPNNTIDTWTVIGHVTAGNIDTGYRRYDSVGVENTLHPNNNFFNLLIPYIKTWMQGKGWI